MSPSDIQRLTPVTGLGAAGKKTSQEALETAAQAKAAVTPAALQNAQSGRTEQGVALEVKSTGLADPSASSVPFDKDRVDAVREALKNDSYPLIPTKIADAMIASSFMLRDSK
jgi:negative regulator of flagellin synthesis FlgM